jgi:acyl-CoA reductase-like NAD-dependent aldehyde dehydrogenase
LQYSAENIIDGVCYNSGQSCCSIERVYVARPVYDEFLKKFVAIAKSYRLGDPLKDGINLGPVISIESADRIRAQVADAVEKGATCLVEADIFPQAVSGTRFVAPQILINCNHTMQIMNEETFGPVVGVMAVDSDEEAVRLMNDSEYGLTCSIWTSDVAAAERIGDCLDTGTVFMNRY